MTNLLSLLTVAKTGTIFLPFQPINVTGIHDGGWTQITDPHAFYYNGYTYVTYVDASGNLEASYIPDGGLFGTPITIAAGFQADTHAAPSMWVRSSDAKLLVAYCEHDGATMYRKISTNSLTSDPTISGGFGSAGDLDASLSGTDYTYPSLGELTSEALSPIYMTYRDWINGSSTGKLAITKSTDQGASWGAQTILVTETGINHYFMAHFGTDRIDFAVSNGNGITDANVDIFHFYYISGSYHKSDGTDLGSPPFTTSSLTKVYETGAGNGWPSGMAIDGTTPIILTQSLVAPLTGPTTIRYHRWNGSNWNATTLRAISGIYVFSALDESDPNIVWTSEPVNSNNEIFYYHTIDSGVNWNRKQITKVSGHDNIYPVNIHNRGTDLVALWLYGTYTNYVAPDYDLQVRGARTL